jgi:hypothetical protein
MFNLDTLFVVIILGAVLSEVFKRVLAGRTDALCIA